MRSRLDSRLVAVACALLASGCQQVFGLDSPQLGHDGGTTPVIDAPLVDGLRPDVLNDTDGDGLSDPDDNCPQISNADQGNEDGDAFGDVCDPCPISTNNIDLDGDGVGDLCDPHPALAGEVIRLFEGFHHGVPAGWTVEGTWTAASDSISTSTGVGGTSNTYLPSFGKHETVSAGGVMTSTFGTGFRTFGVHDDSTPGGYAIVCSLLITSSTDASPNTPMVDLFQLPAGSVIRRNSMSWAVGDQLIVYLTRTDGNYVCLGEDRTMALSRFANGSDNVDTANAQVGFHVFAAAARYDWMMIVTSP